MTEYWVILCNINTEGWGVADSRLYDSRRVAQHEAGHLAHQYPDAPIFVVGPLKVGTRNLSVAEARRRLGLPEEEA